MNSSIATIHAGRWGRVGAGLGVGLIFFWLAVRQTNWADFEEAVRQASPVWILVGMACYAVAIGLRILRWKMIFNFVVPLNFRQVAVALVVGYAVNSLLPARLGELFRADFCKRQYGVKRSLVLGTIAIERLMDGIFVVTALVIGIVFAQGPFKTDISLDWLATLGAILFASVGVALYYLGGDYAFPWLERWPAAQPRIAALRSSARLVRHPTIITIGLVTLPVWAFDTAAVWAMMRTCDIALNPIEMCAAVGIVSLSTLLPSPPGFLGTMQFAYALSATMFGYSAAQGIAAATANQVFLLGSVAVIGLAQLGRHFVADLRQSSDSV